MNRWMPVVLVTLALLLWQCSEKKEVVTATESSTITDPMTNSSSVPEPVPVVSATQPSAEVSSTVSAPSPAGPPLRNPAGATPAADPVAAVRRIDLRDAELLVASGEAIMVDVRSEADYAKSHVRGAINIPVAMVQARALELPRDKMIITYCT